LQIGLLSFKNIIEKRNQIEKEIKILIKHGLL